VRWWSELGDGIVEFADEAGGAAELVVVVQEVDVVGPGDDAGDEGEHLA
jgi:hypothetical protein